MFFFSLSIFFVLLVIIFFFFFFFQAEDGIRDHCVTGVQTCALPISLAPLEREVRAWRLPNGLEVSERRVPIGVVGANFEARPNVAVDIASQVLKSGNAVVLRTGGRSEERRVGKECR